MNKLEEINSAYEDYLKELDRVDQNKRAYVRFKTDKELDLLIESLLSNTIEF